MSICSSGLSSPGPLQPVTIAVAPTHPLIQLAQVIPWQALAQLVLPDLQHTTAKRKWWIGRKLQLRIHLGAFLLQWLYNLTDRRVEWGIKDNAASNCSAAGGWWTSGIAQITPRSRNSAPV